MSCAASNVEFHVIMCNELVCLAYLSVDGAAQSRRNSEGPCVAGRNKKLILIYKLNKRDPEVAG